MFSKFGLAVLWSDGHVCLPRMTLTHQLVEENTHIWHCIVKFTKNRYVVSGLNRITDPYSQVIKLVDSQCKTIDKIGLVFGRVKQMDVILNKSLLEMLRITHNLMVVYILLKRSLSSDTAETVCR